MKLLAVDTSGTVCGVAILTEDGIRHECAVMNHKTHSVNLLPMIDNAFQSTGLTIQDMDRLAVAAAALVLAAMPLFSIFLYTMC